MMKGRGFPAFSFIHLKMYKMHKKEDESLAILPIDKSTSIAV